MLTSFCIGCAVTMVVALVVCGYKWAGWLVEKLTGLPL